MKTHRIRKLFRENYVEDDWKMPAEPVTHDTPLTVTLSVNDWLHIRTQLGAMALVNEQREEPATAAITHAVLAQLHEQTDEFTNAAEAEIES